MVINDNTRVKILLVSLFLIVIIFSLSFLAYAQTRFLSYLPRDEELDGKSITYDPPSTLNMVSAGESCPNILFLAHAECKLCLNDLKILCPNCCFVDHLASPKEIRCSEGDTERGFDYGCDKKKVFNCDALDVHEDCNSFPEDGSPCPGTERVIQDSDINLCQQLGCPSSPVVPDPDRGERCTLHSDGHWYCTEGDFTPGEEEKGCVPLTHWQNKVDEDGNSVLGYVSGFHGSRTSSFFDVTVHAPEEECEGEGEDEVCEDVSTCPAEVLDELNPGGSGSIDTCYEYEVKSAYSDYITSCRNSANESQKCEKSIECCENDWMCNPPPCLIGDTCETGLENCEIDDFDDPEGDCACKKINDWTVCNPTIQAELGECFTCDQLTPQICEARRQNYVNCLVDADSTCRNCFADIDSDFSYQFVAKSSEEAVVIWIIHPPEDSMTEEGVTTYFYSLIKVCPSDSSEDDSCHESIIHQKSFQGDFSVYSATHVPEGFLRQGETYTVKLYYFIPHVTQLGIDDDIDLSLDVRRIDLIVYRIRE